MKKLAFVKTALLAIVLLLIAGGIVLALSGRLSTEKNVAQETDVLRGWTGTPGDDSRRISSEEEWLPAKPSSAEHQRMLNLLASHNSFYKKSEIAEEITVDLDANGVEEKVIAFLFLDSFLDLTGGVAIFGNQAERLELLYVIGCEEFSSDKNYCLDSLGATAPANKNDIVDLAKIIGDKGEEGTYVESAFTLNGHEEHFNVISFHDGGFHTLSLDREEVLPYLKTNIYIGMLGISVDIEKNKIIYKEIGFVNNVSNFPKRWRPIITLRYDGRSLVVESIEDPLPVPILTREKIIELTNYPSSCDPSTCSEIIVDYREGEGGIWRFSILLTGARDDSATASRTSGTIAYQNGEWVLLDSIREWKCQPGRGHQDFSTELCL